MTKPILFLIFKRPEETLRVFEAIRKVKPKKIYIASDGPRESKHGESDIVQKLRGSVINAIDWDCEIKTKFSKYNEGCRVSVSSSISWFFDNEDEGIILEDDCLPSETFFRFCEETLEKYRMNKNVMHISGHNFSPNFIDESSYYFAKIQHCWGWASWSDRWKLYGKNLNNFPESELVKFSKNLKVQNYWRNILKRMQNNEIDSWAYQWAFKIVQNNGLCIDPSVNLVSNIGFGKEATHTLTGDDRYANIPVVELPEIIHPKKIRLDNKAVNYIYRNHYGILM